MIQFFDSNICLGNKTIPFRPNMYDKEVMHRRLSDCCVVKGLAYHSASVEDNPAFGNNLILEEIKETPFRPIWAAIPLSTNEMGSAADFKKSLKKNKVAGLLLYAKSHSYNNDEWLMGEIYDICEQMRLPVFIRCNLDFEWGALFEFARRRKNIPIILRDARYSNDRYIYKLMEKCKNIYLETANYAAFEGIEQICIRFSAKRLIFGSKTPDLSVGAIIARIMLANISNEEKQMIAYKNLEGLLSEVDYE